MSSTAGEPILGDFQPGAWVEVTQQIPHREGTWVTKVRGEIVAFHQCPTGSWFAHAKDDKFWLDRLTLRLADGEIAELVLDGYSRVERVEQVKP